MSCLIESWTVGSTDQAGVFPGEELVDQFPADLIFPEQHLKELVAEEVFQFLYVYFRKDVKPPVRHEAAVGDEAMARTARMHCHPYFRMIEDSKIR